MDANELGLDIDRRWCFNPRARDGRETVGVLN